MDSVDYKKVGENIRMARIKAGLSQKELAEMADVNRSALSSIENGKRGISVHRLKKVADALGKDVEELLVKNTGKPVRPTTVINDGKYTIELTEAQMRVVQTALEEWFRLRMGQEMDFCNDLAGMNVDLSPENPNHNWLFDKYLSRRDHMQEIMRAFFRIAFEPNGYLQEKSNDMLIAETVWDSIRFARGLSKWSQPLQVGPEPCPKIEKRG